MKNDKTFESTYIVKTLADGKSSNLITEIQKLENEVKRYNDLQKFTIIQPILILIGLFLIIREFKTKQMSSFYFGFMLGISLVSFISILSKKGYMQAFFETLQAFFKALF